MCMSPNHIWQDKGNGYEQIPVPCKTCSLCRSNRLNDYIGRCLCELATSDWAKAVTLTYRPGPDGGPRDDLAEVVFNPQHVRQFIMNLRNSGLKIRYLITGELGEKKGRVHYHAILFGKGPLPRVSIKKKQQRYSPLWEEGRTHVDAWPHGHVFVDSKVDQKSIRYVCKYILKDWDKTETWFTCSKKPSLGTEWFERKADRAVADDVMPRSFEYAPPGGTPGKNYMITGATRRNYLLRILEGLVRKNSPRLLSARTGLFAQPIGTLSEWVDKGLTKVLTEKWKKEIEEFQKTNVEEAWKETRERFEENQALTKLDVVRYLNKLQLEAWKLNETIKGLSHGEKIEPTQQAQPSQDGRLQPDDKAGTTHTGNS